MIARTSLGVPGASVAVECYTPSSPVSAWIARWRRPKQWMERQHSVLMAGFLAVVGVWLVYMGIRAL